MGVGSQTAGETLDELVADLTRLRERTGATSYAEIARRITVRRVALGDLPDGAMIPRSTVYHAFSKGRSRIDAELVRDIVLALGENAASAENWVRRCGSARKHVPARAPERAPERASGDVSTPLAVVRSEAVAGEGKAWAELSDPTLAAGLAPVVGRIEPRTGSVPAVALSAASHSALAVWASPRAQAQLAAAPEALAAAPEAVATLAPLTELPPATEQLGEPEGEPAAEVVPSSSPSPRRRTRAQRARFVALLLLACLALNLGGQLLVTLLHLPVYLDMIGTAVAALAFGPGAGVLIGLASNGVGVAVNGPMSLPFALVNIAGALVWAYGVRRFRGGDTFLRFFSLTIVVAVVCSLVATPILTFGYAGITGHGSENVVRLLSEGASSVMPGVFASNVLSSITDKLLTGFVALALLVPLARRGGADVQHLPVVDQLATSAPPATPEAVR